MVDPPVDIVDRHKPLTIEVASDRCDTCGAEAFVYAELEHGSVAYCGHHGTEYLPELTRQAITVIDLRHLIGQ